MGLCKCPKRKVTNQFCYEHRVNVCEYCMVTNHPQCIVQSYLQWLEDNDYNAICELCKNPLGTSNCIRLICYHVFHQHCLHEMGKRIAAEAESNEGSYCCPSCGKNLFPPSNMISPVADALKDVLMKANWARNIMGLPELQDCGMSPIASFSRPEPLGALSGADNMDPGIHGGKQRFPASVHSADVGVSLPDSYHAHGTSVRRLGDFDASPEERPRSFHDEPDDKYKLRKPRFDGILKWWSDLVRPSQRQLRDVNFRRKRVATFVVMGLVALYLVVQFFSWLGRIPDDDPAFNEKLNPFVRQEE